MQEMFPMQGNYKVIRTNVAKVPPFARQLVDVIIPYHGAYEKVASLVQSLIYNTQLVNFRVCLVDDCSPNSTFIQTAFEPFANIKKIRNVKQLGFGASLKEGFDALAREKRGGFPWVVFLHSDVEIVDKNWLVSLGETMLALKGEGVKMVGAMSDNPTVDDPLFKADESVVLNPRQDVILTEGYLPLYCVLCHRDLFARIGGFVANFPFTGYEDREIADRMRAKGFKQAICGKTWVHHEGGATRKVVTEGNPRAKMVMEQQNQMRWLSAKKTDPNPKYQ